jgi:putative hydrolase of the HAD superfamily
MQPTLVFDADDTLWDEQSMLQRFEARVEALLDRLTGCPSHFRKRFIDTEAANIPALGYGFASYVYSVGETLSSEPAWRPYKAALLGEVARLIAGMQSAAPRVIEGVRPTLSFLSRRHYRLALLTRGVHAEQRDKLDRAGLAHFFSSVHVVSRKDASVYRAAACELGDPAGATLCMIGNSMRSDVGPALEAGWRAIHVPPPTQWAHDASEESGSARFRRARTFRQVAEFVKCADFWG